MKISRTPFCACLRYKGYSFAWFHDSILAVMVANELLRLGLISEIQIYRSLEFKGFDVSSLADQGTWTPINVRDNEVFISYHRLYKKSECRQIGSVISRCMNDYNSRLNYESCCD